MVMGGELKRRSSRVRLLIEGDGSSPTCFRPGGASVEEAEDCSSSEFERTEREARVSAAAMAGAGAIVASGLMRSSGSKCCDDRGDMLDIAFGEMGEEDGEEDEEDSEEEGEEEEYSEDRGEVLVDEEDESEAEPEDESDDDNGGAAAQVESLDQAMAALGEESEVERELRESFQRLMLHPR
eukprot:4981567-Prymnesium_polylepis.1